MKKFLLFLLPLLMFSCNNSTQNTPGEENSPSFNSEEAKTEINTTLENWHKAAAEANFDGYFDLMAAEGVFIGTDAAENWNIKEFQNFSKPHFDKGTAWSFSTLERNIYTSENGGIAWFDELLETWMGVCRGSGVMVEEEGEWKIKHYVLSVTIPNDNINEIVKINKEIDSTIIQTLRTAQ
ncbi:MAG TPA: nuclear transport factor 2 family protein [Gillisia sp.]|nr:nuclear transport factor 2 family protein [Gillisia sp.]